MAWLCERCGDFFWEFGEDYCSYCRRKMREEYEKQIQEQKEKEKRRIKILKDIESYKQKQIEYLNEKYDVEVHIDTAKSFAKDVHDKLIFVSSEVLQILKWNFGNSFIDKKGEIKEDKLKQEIKKLEKKVRSKIPDVYIKEVSSLSYSDVEEMLGIKEISSFFEDEKIAYEKYILLEADSGLIASMKKRVDIEKIYHRFVKKYKKLHHLLIQEHTRKNIEKFILKRIDYYSKFFHSSKIKIITDKNEFEQKISLLNQALEIQEIQQLLDEIRTPNEKCMNKEGNV